MKNIILAGATLILATVGGSALAANSLNAGTFGLSVPVVASTSPIISGKYFFAKDMALEAGFGFSSGGVSGASATTMALLVGARKYLKVDDFAPFVGAYLKYTTVSSSPATTSMELAAQAGAEYFLAKQFSVEGKVAFGYTSNDTGVAATKTTYFGTGTAGLSVNYYF